MTQDTKRLPPTLKTTRSLYLKSGNLCAFPGCHHLIIDGDGDYTGEICHIEAASIGGPRFNTAMSDEERRDEKNLLLLCRNHHKKIDESAAYSVGDLKKFKEDHESKFLDPGRKIFSSFSDSYIENKCSFPENIDKFLNFINEDSIEERLYYYQDLKKYLDLFSKAPDNLREFASNFSRRLSLKDENKIMKNSSGYPCLSLSSIKFIFDKEGDDLFEILDMMNDYNILRGDYDVVEGEYNEREIVLLLPLPSCDPNLASHHRFFWLDLAKFCDHIKTSSIKDICMSLNFQCLAA